ncbi:hypothetical protein [Oceanobacillus sojae]|nr:hypothetical protein [Oceanobacillus sojae]
MNTDYWTNLDYIPKHVAMICDGNGRWAKKRGNKQNYFVDQR